MQHWKECSKRKGRCKKLRFGRAAAKEADRRVGWVPAASIKTRGNQGAVWRQQHGGAMGHEVAPAAWRGHGVRGGVGASECSLVGGKNEGMHHAYWEKEGWV